MNRKRAIFVMVPMLGLWTFCIYTFWQGRLSPTFYGLHRFSPMTLVVSSGLGGRGSRLRSGCSAEYVIISLHGT